MQIHLKDGKKTFSKVSFIDLAGTKEVQIIWIKINRQKLMALK
jgi:hypothetical protein